MDTDTDTDINWDIFEDIEVVVVERKKERDVYSSLSSIYIWILVDKYICIYACI